MRFTPYGSLHLNIWQSDGIVAVIQENNAGTMFGELGQLGEDGTGNCYPHITPLASSGACQHPDRVGTVTLIFGFDRFKIKVDFNRF